MISDFKILNNAFHAAEFWWVVGLPVILRLLQKKNSTSLLSAVFILA